MGGRIVGVDVGGTKVAAATMRDGRFGPVVDEPTDTSSTEALLAQLTRVVRERAQADGDDAPLAAAGFALPSVVDRDAGAIRFSVNVPLAGLPLQDELRGRLDGLPCFIDNDATCAALAEAQGEHDETPPAAMVLFTVGTGVGGGIVIEGKTFRGATGAAAELGHTIIGLQPLDDGAPPAQEDFPQPASLETLASGTGFGPIAERFGFADGRAATRAALDGDERGREAVRVLGERLGIGIANAMNTFDPDEVVIGGGLSAAGELLLGPAERVARQYALRGVGTKTRIRTARYGNEAGVRGAALMAAQELQGEVLT